MRTRSLAVALLVLLASACATAYAPKNATGGYVEEWRSPTELEVSFHHNDGLTVEDARDLATRRAAELALEAGARYLLIWGERLHRQKIAGPQYAVVQAQFLDGPMKDAVDAIEVVRRTEGLAQGRLSAEARQRIKELGDPPPTP